VLGDHQARTFWQRLPGTRRRSRLYIRLRDPIDSRPSSSGIRERWSSWLASSGPRLVSPGGQGQVLQCNADLYELGPLGLQRRPESAVRIVAEVVGLQEDAHLAYLANVPEGRPVGSPAVYAVIRPLGHRTVSARNSPPALMTTTHPAGGSGGRVIRVARSR